MPPKKSTPVRKPVVSKPGTKAPVRGAKTTNASTSKAGTGTSKGAPSKKSSKTKVAVPKGPSKEDLAATKIQTCIRGFLARQRSKNAALQKQKYEQEILELEKQAYIAIVERERAEQEKRDEKERQKRQKETRRKKRQKVMLESAFDDEVDELQKIVKEAINELDDRTNEAANQREIRALIEARDANDNSPIGEAGAGGANDVIGYLVENGANINHKGQWGRTALYRAAFAGHADTVSLLLNSGADPRIAASDSNTPKDAAGNKDIAQLFDDWDISKTEDLIKKHEEHAQKYKNLQREDMAKAVGGIEDQVAEKQRIFTTVKKELQTAYCEFEKRVLEHDKAVLAGFEKPELTLASINDAEMHLELCKVKMEKAQLELSQAQLKLREQQHMQRNMDNSDGDEFVDSDPMAALVSRCNIKELTDVLFKDVGNKIKESGKWPLIMDATGQASLFLRYRDTNMLNVLDTRACETAKLREALLGSIRYGKPLIVDLGAMDLWDAMEAMFDRIQTGLFSLLLSKALMENMAYMNLVTADTKEEYQPAKFVHHMANDFRFVVLTKMSCPPMDWIEKLYAVEVIVSKKD